MWSGLERGMNAMRIQALAGLLLAVPQGAPASPQRDPLVPARPSERCTVCGASLKGEDVAVIVRGRRFPLCRTEVGAFMRDQEKHLSRKQPRSALFQEDLSAPPGITQGEIGPGWFFFGLLVLSSLVFGGLSAYHGLSRGHSPVASFFLGFCLNGLGYLRVISRPASRDLRPLPRGLVKVPTTAQPLPCPACEDFNHPAARRCITCGQDLCPEVPSEVTRT